MDLNDLKPDYVDLVTSIYKTHGFSSLSTLIPTLTTPQLTQLKPNIPEVKEIITTKQAENQSKRKRLISNTNTIQDTIEANGELNRRRSSRAKDSKDTKLVCEF